MKALSTFNATTPESGVLGLEDLISPIKPQVFMKKYWDQVPYHGKGYGVDRFGSLLSWETLQERLSIPALWTPQNLQLVKDGDYIPADQYCHEVSTQQGRVLRPDPGRVMAWLQRGASLVCNELEGMTPGLRAMSRLLGKTFQAKIQTNLYLSWEKQQAFKSHFDTHEVWVFQLLGKKRWHVYQGRHDAPIPHPAFRHFGQAYHDQAKGDLDLDIVLEPGDLLYIPRGIYHDALALSQTSLHVTFGLTRPLGLDVLSLLFERGIHASFFRQAIPLDTDPSLYLQTVAKQCGDLLDSPEFSKMLSDYQQQFFEKTQDYELDTLLSKASGLKKRPI